MTTEKPPGLPDIDLAELDLVAWGIKKGQDLAEFHLQRAQHFQAALKQIARAIDECQYVDYCVDIAKEALKEKFSVTRDD